MNSFTTLCILHRVRQALEILGRVKNRTQEHAMPALLVPVTFESKVSRMRWPMGRLYGSAR